MTRIIAGAAGGSTLASVEGTGTRPTTDRVKEALFSRLESYGVLHGAHVLDLYAGSGSLGVESASRGAATVDLVESADRAALVAQKNADLVNRVLGWTAVRVHRAKVETYLDRAAVGAAWDLVLMDPPYTVDEGGVVAVLAALQNRLADGAVVVVERSTRSPEPVWPTWLERFSDKKYGETRLWFLEPAAA
ncbi:16S rRNA (guanine(966)-N(2))-methyltransferase RsmD [Arthrobacter agilis]|uniref:16S rRNA (guanine(966)-N(2))-methyltransferase RsmD n=1 Tax=Arthrobacter agilis TaxID=37921 RepID=UPI000B359BD0|nr:16S rRNA (guanine(966)-N(2))-methyltransferase RsmD [Arthrobacter agilis]OUM44841.1 16S rRNA (guanine(966)-N(2))-methyltransferase RsmD [Arthrobacter agilis]PPB47165.1 16S rRNA (guanine(966)-N(2))-methyltransferase RsmD [Arthrobacter agilis]TPV22579.1 16S rRNA (guanine(966)-N(2))-methyltransferase RsmD [Arthrobacter agilis]VDR32405.1 Ribosomal RNA small subunit methyltransferase D [Arthrobacter agilis]